MSPPSDPGQQEAEGTGCGELWVGLLWVTGKQPWGHRDKALAAPVCSHCSEHQKERLERRVALHELWRHRLLGRGTERNKPADSSVLSSWTSVAPVLFWTWGLHIQYVSEEPGSSGAAQPLLPAQSSVRQPGDPWCRILCVTGVLSLRALSVTLTSPSEQPQRLSVMQLRATAESTQGTSACRLWKGQRTSHGDDSIRATSSRTSEENQLPGVPSSTLDPHECGF